MKAWKKSLINKAIKYEFDGGWTLNFRSAKMFKLLAVKGCLFGKLLRWIERNFKKFLSYNKFNFYAGRYHINCRFGGKKILEHWRVKVRGSFRDFISIFRFLKAFTYWSYSLHKVLLCGSVWHPEHGILSLLRGL